MKRYCDWTVVWSLEGLDVLLLPQSDFQGPKHVLETGWAELCMEANCVKLVDQ